MANTKIASERITIRELAAMVNTTPATVSRALSGKYGLSDALREKITGLAKKHGYVPNQMARNLQQGGSQFIGFLAADLTNSTYISIFRELESQCRKKGFSLVIADSERLPELEQEHVEYFLRLTVRGMFVFPVADWKSQTSTEHLDTFSRNGIATVVLGRVFRPGISTVFSDETNVSKRLVERFQKLGHKRFLIIPYEFGESNVPARIRFETMSEAILAIPGGVLTDIIKPKSHSDWKQQVVQAVLRQDNRPTAVLAVYAYDALALYGPFAEAGIRIPQDVSLGAFGGTTLYERWIEDISPPLTACHVNEKAVADAAMALLFEKIDHPANPDKHQMIPQLICIRGSLAKAGDGAREDRCPGPSKTR